ncbi:MAG: methylenetetrahydrofolate reductase [NAD(P)H] [Rickettsiales bacterium]|nr:methylenetetrahydrofolate reductase [NAD(P)H] [Rickettsiales bacterium]
MKIYKNKLEEIVLSKREINVSFEFFPPKTDEMEIKLWEAISTLKNLKPNFVSVTYGAGGSTRERTHHTIKRIIDETDLKPASHLTCIAASKSEIDEILYNYWQIGVRHIVALRGDMPASSPNYQLHPEGYKYANELVAGIKKLAKQGMDFEISVAGYPEKHPESLNFDQDIDNLKRKVDAGATRIITQFFFDAEVYFSFVEKCRKAKITVPIVPGILPVSNVKQTKHFAKMCGAKIPKWMNEIFESLDERQETRQLIAGIVAVEMCRILHDAGVNDFHFYTLNRSDLTTAICHILGVKEF